MDKDWYEGCVKCFDKYSNKHLVLYDDGEEEMLDLGKEKIEWVQRNAKGFKRLRRASSLAFKKVVLEDDEEMEEINSGNVSDSSDEDWDKNKDMEKEKVSDDEEIDLVDEEEEKIMTGRKRKASGGGKKSKSGGDEVKGGFKVSLLEPMKKIESK